MKRSKLLYEIVATLAIILIIVFRFDFVTEYVNGAQELDWAYDGFTDTNMSLRLLFLFGVAGYGIYWIIWKYARRNKMPVMIFSVLIAAVAMSYSFFFYYVLPMAVVIIIAILKIKEHRRNNEESSCDRIEGIHREDTLPPSG